MKKQASAWNASILYILFIVCILYNPAAAQKIIKGTIEDQHSGERIPFASIKLKRAGIGRTADSSGNFLFFFPAKQKDTLETTSVGYEDHSIAVDIESNEDTLHYRVRLVPGKMNMGVVVKGKSNRGLYLWRKIVARKPMNDRYRFENFSYELYNKLEIDIKNVDGKNMERSRLLKPFRFMISNIDTSEASSYLPAYLTEAVSDYYYQARPVKRREVFKAVKTMGVKNESASRLLGGMDQIVNIYNNFIPVFNLQFVSPISDNGDAHYRYKVADTQYVQGRRIIHLIFKPLHKGSNTFEGDCWVHDTTYAIQKMNLRLGKDANINFVDMISLIQEYQLIDDTTWFLSKDKFVADLSPANIGKIALIGRKTTTYRNIKLNDTSITAVLLLNRMSEETILSKTAASKADEFWSTARHEPLNKNEKSIYHTLDTVLKMPVFKKYTRIIELLATGCYDLGNYKLGPFYNWVSGNQVEGTRIRFDMSTNTDFSKKFIVSGYIAYGFNDQEWKGRIRAKYLFNKSPRMYVLSSYSKDFDYGQEYMGNFASDNLFALAIRKTNVPIKFLILNEQKLELFKEWANGFSLLLIEKHKGYRPVKNLPLGESYPTEKGNPLTSFELSVTARYAYLEKFLENTFYRSSLGSPYPIVEIKYTRGISGIERSSYDFQKISGSISNTRKIAPVGTLYFNLFAGKTYGTLPYLFLDVAPGNEVYYYNKFAFNMMNRFEFIHDQYAGMNVEHNMGSGLFRYTSLTRKLKWRQFWNAKAMWGRLGPENRALNFANGYPFQSLDEKSYMELGTGVDNIFKIFRLDFVWRVRPPAQVSNDNRQFGVFGSLKVAF